MVCHEFAVGGEGHFNKLEMDPYGSRQPRINGFPQGKISFLGRLGTGDNGAKEPRQHGDQ